MLTVEAKYGRKWNKQLFDAYRQDTSGVCGFGKYYMRYLCW